MEPIGETRRHLMSLPFVERMRPPLLHANNLTHLLDARLALDVFKVWNLGARRLVILVDLCASHNFPYAQAERINVELRVGVKTRF